MEQSARSARPNNFIVVLLAVTILLSCIELPLATSVYKEDFFIVIASLCLVGSLSCLICLFLIKDFYSVFNRKMTTLVYHLGIGVLLFASAIHYLVRIQEYKEAVLALNQLVSRHFQFEFDTTKPTTAAGLGIIQSLICGVTAILTYKQ